MKSDWPWCAPESFWATMIIEFFAILCYCHRGILCLTSLYMKSIRNFAMPDYCRRTIRRVTGKCGWCNIYNVKHLNFMPVPLPYYSEGSRVFEVMGIDLACPLFLKGGLKDWIVLFTCAIYWALHLELVMSLYIVYRSLSSGPALLHSQKGKAISNLLG